MSDAVWIASVFGPYLTILGLWMLVYSDNLVKVISSIKNTPSSFYVLGVINLLVGLAIINTYNTWMFDLAFLVTLLGWVTLLRGVLIFFTPQLIFGSKMSKPKTMKMVGIVPLVWGLLLCWLAFHA